MAASTIGKINLESDLKLRSLLKAIERSSSETTVLRFWDTVIPIFFPASEGYKSYVKFPDSKKDEMRHAAVFGVKRILCGAQNPEEWVSKEISAVVCMRPTHDVPEDWKGVRDELFPYMLFTPYSDAHDGPPAEFVVVAMGAKVQISRWKSGNFQPRMEPMHDKPLDLFSSEDVEQVEKLLNDFKDETWDYKKWEPAKNEDIQYDSRPASSGGAKIMVPS